MATINGLTAARMLEIEGQSIVDGDVVGDDLILTKFDGTTKNAGSVRGAQGFPGISDMNLYDPIGVPKPLLIPTVPAGYGVCNATDEFDAGPYPVLSAAFGTGPACVNGPAAVGKFKLPDLRGRTIFGLHAGIPAFDTLREAGGNKDAVVVSHGHTASSDQAPHGHGFDISPANHDHTHGTGDGGSHFHTGNIANVQADSNPTHTHTGNGGYVSEGHSSGNIGSTAPLNIDTDGNHNHGATGGASSTSHDHGFTFNTEDPAITTTVSTEGVSGTDANLPPYRVANWIMRLA